MAMLDLGGESLAEYRQLLPVRCKNVGRQPPISIFSPLRSEQEQIRELARGQPWEPATLVEAANCESPVTLETMPAEYSPFEWLSAHRFDGITKNCFDLSDYDLHFGASYVPLAPPVKRKFADGNQIDSCSAATRANGSRDGDVMDGSGWTG